MSSLVAFFLVNRQAVFARRPSLNLFPIVLSKLGRSTLQYPLPFRGRGPLPEIHTSVYLGRRVRPHTIPSLSPRLARHNTIRPTLITIDP